MVNVYLIRLGETENNVKGVLSGRKIDSPLTRSGIDQSYQVAEILSGTGIHVIYSSPMPRVIETATPLAKMLNTKIVPVEELSEIDLGDCDGLSFSDLAATDAGKEFLKDPTGLTFPGATESVSVTQAHAVRKMKELLSGAEHGSSIAMYTHGGTMRLILLHVLGLDSSLAMFHRISIGNCAFAHILQKDDGTLLFLGLANFGGPLLGTGPAAIKSRDELPTVRLRRATEADWLDYKRLRLDPRLVDWMGSPLPIDDTRLELERQRFLPEGQKNWIHCGVEDEFGKHIGDTRLKREDTADHTGPRVPLSHGIYEFGIGLDCEHWGKGYGSAATIAMLDRAFLQENAERVYGIVWDRNTQAIRCLEKAGFKIEGKLRHYKYKEIDKDSPSTAPHDIKWRDMCVMGILREDYQRIFQ